MTFKTFNLLFVAMVLFASMAFATPPHSPTCVKVTVERNGIDLTAYNWTYNVEVLRQSLRERTNRFSVSVKHPSVCERRIGKPVL